MHVTPNPPKWIDGMSSYALVLGIVAAVCLVVPVIGDVLAFLPALASVVLAVVAIHRHESGREVRVWPALVGAALGMVVLFVVVVMFLVTHAFS